MFLKGERGVRGPRIPKGYTDDNDCTINVVISRDTA